MIMEVCGPVCHHFVVNESCHLNISGDHDPGVTGLSPLPPPQGIRHPFQKGGDIPRNIAPGGEYPRNIAPL
jgi:hypothetical protein